MGLQDGSGYFIQPVSYGFIDRNEEITLFFCSKKKVVKWKCSSTSRKSASLSIVFAAIGSMIGTILHVSSHCERSAASKKFLTKKRTSAFRALRALRLSKEEIEFDHILSDPSLGFYKIDLRDVVTKKVL